MKFITALLLATTVSAAEVPDQGDCTAADATCITASCCGTVTPPAGTDGPATKVCSTKPGD